MPPVPGQFGVCWKVLLISPRGRPGLGFCVADTSAQSVKSQPPLIHSAALVAPCSRGAKGPEAASEGRAEQGA